MSIDIKTKWVIQLRLLMIPFLLILSLHASAEELDDDDPQEDLALRGDALCTVCHDETSDNPILSIGKTKHGTTADYRTPTCTTCHGDGGNHKESPRKTPMPQRTFGRNSVNSIVVERILRAASSSCIEVKCSLMCSTQLPEGATT